MFHANIRIGNPHCPVCGREILDEGIERPVHGQVKPISRLVRFCGRACAGRAHLDADGCLGAALENAAVVQV